MAIANFEQLCRSFCEIAGFKQPSTLDPNAQGTAAMSVRMRGVVVTAMEFKETRGSTAHLVAEMGAVPEDTALAAWEALLEPNLCLLGGDAPRFSRNPDSGEAVMQWSCPLWSVTPTDVYGRVALMVDTALRWRLDRFAGADLASLLRPLMPAAVVLDGTAEARYSSQFKSLRTQICEALGQDAGEPLDVQGNCGFPMHLDGVPIGVHHLPQQDPRFAFVAMGFGIPPTESRLSMSASLMDANFEMMSRPDISFGRSPSTGELVLQYAYPLDEGNGRHCLSQVTRLAQMAKETRTALSQAGAPA